MEIKYMRLVLEYWEIDIILTHTIFSYSALVHENIVQFIGIAVPPDNSKLYLVTELMHYGTVRDILDKKAKNLPFEMRLQMAKDAAKGM